ncbi:hypothetical protein E0W72_07690 [Flavobacterium arcticum]|nr:hypothetical protein [Flavobacterium arcticum]KAF2510356.1 hypothetical protein E0W72_07690 [Flavobacterium arcticum]
MKKWKKIARQNKRGKISQQETVQQLLHELQAARLYIELEHSLIKEQEQQILEEQTQKLTVLTANFDQYVEAENAKLPESVFTKIDLLKTPLDKIKGKIEELKNAITFK